METTRPIPPNSVARLNVSFGGKLFEDMVHVVRCDVIAGYGDVHRVAARFLSVGPPSAGSLRYAMRQEISDLAAWLNDEEA
jgi:hypothetical protein